MQQEMKQIDRREFLVRCVKAGASIAFTGALSYLLYESGDEQAVHVSEAVSLPDFSVPPLPGKTIAIVQGRERVSCMEKAIDLLGGIGRFINPGDTVLIKPNIAFASPPRLGATTNPELVAGLVRLCLSAKAKRVIITDNPINAPESSFLLTGIGRAASTAGGEVILPKKNSFMPGIARGGRLLVNWPVLYEPFRNVNKVIGVSPVKSHQRSGASMAMKNWYGLLGGRRNIFHQDINTIIAELSIFVKPTLVILDGIEVMMTNGPTGGSLSDLQRRNQIIASCDQVAADAYGCSLLDLRARDLPYIGKSEKAGAGTSDYKSLKPLYASIV